MKAYEDRRKVAVITGACGGMGQACARLLGQRFRLVLADIDQARIDDFARQLAAEGYTVSGAFATDVGAAADVGRLAERTAALGELGALVHTAGLSPALAPWRSIVQVNLVGTARLLDAFLPLATCGSAAVCIASVAGHGPVPDRAQALIDAPLAPDLLERLESVLRADRQLAQVPFGLEGQAYGISKFAVIRYCEQRAAAWALRGARLVSVSPGMIATPMGRREMDVNALAAAMMDSVPLRRVGTPLDIANAVDFLCSERAGYINGCDLRVDFGAVAGMRFGSASRPA